MENRLWQDLARQLDAGTTSALATVVRTRGSTPREPGARMLIGPGRNTAGTVGGGCGEADVLERASRVLAGWDPETVDVSLTGQYGQDGVAVCGGRMEILVDRWEPHDLEDAELLADAESRGTAAGVAVIFRSHEEAWQTGTRAVLVPNNLERAARKLGLADDATNELHSALRNDGPSCWIVTHSGELEPASNRPMTPQQGAAELFVDLVPRNPHLVVVGSGHIAQPLCEMGKLLGFRVTIVDDRAQYANEERFPQADEIRVGEFEEMLSQLEFDDSSYVVIVTRGHQHDEASLRTVMNSEVAPRYVGMISSQRRAKMTLQKVQESGVSRERLSRVFSPIGVDISAETPAEIALAIAAEIVVARRGNPEGFKEPLEHKCSILRSMWTNGASRLPSSVGA